MLAKKLHEELSHQGVTLVAVTKNQSVQRIEPLYGAGLRDFGENRVQELMSKKDAFPYDVKWHVIGHLQSNKVKQIAPFVHLVHSVDSEKLWAELNRQAFANNRVIDFLLQLHVAKEESKYGLTENDLVELASPEKIARYPNTRLRGLMTMATNTDDENLIRSEFQTAHRVFDTIRKRLGGNANALIDTVSMGMSGDFQIAIECGANMVRIGSLLFEDQTSAV